MNGGGQLVGTPGGKYLQPSPLLREMLLLDYLCTTPHCSQAELASVAGVTPAMVNAYLSRFVTEGLITKELMGRGAIYTVTPPGARQRDYHLISYLAELSSLAARSQEHFREYFRTMAHAGLGTVVFYGAGETARVAGAALERTQVQLVGIVDDDAAKQGQELFGHRILAPEQILSLKPDAVLVTSWHAVDAILAKLGWVAAHGITVRSLVSNRD